MRLSFCYPTPEAIRVGIRRLATVVNGELDLLDTFAGTGTLQLPPSAELRIRPALRPQVVEKPLIMSESSGLYVVVLAGGISHERDVSLRSGRRVADALTAAGHRVVLRDPDAAPAAVPARTSGPTSCSPRCTGRAAKTDRCSTSSSALGVAVVGSTGAAARRAWSKPVASSLVARARASRSPSRSCSRTRRSASSAPTSVLAWSRTTLEGDLVVKPGSGGSAQGVTIVEDTNDLPRAMVEAFTYGDVAVVEQRIVGTEIAVAVVDTGDGPVALPAGRDRADCRASTASRPATTPGRPRSTRRRGSPTT